MAFIREYMDAGDPFSLRVPKKFRKLKVGRAIGRGVRGIAHLAGAVPGLGIADRLVGLLTSRGVPADAATEFARSYGFDMGDAPAPSQKRKGAGAGPKAKAAKKRAKRAGRAHATGGAHTTSARGGLTGREVGGIIARNAAGAAATIGGSIARHGTDLGGILADALRGGGGGGGGRGGFGGHRRSMNPANVKALRRSLRRVEGFQKLQKRIAKAFPVMRPHHAAAPVHHRRKK
jgi:hypothetical protein